MILSVINLLKLFESQKKNIYIKYKINWRTEPQNRRVGMVIHNILLITVPLSIQLIDPILYWFLINFLCGGQSVLATGFQCPCKYKIHWVWAQRRSGVGNKFSLSSVSEALTKPVKINNISFNILSFIYHVCRPTLNLNVLQFKIV